MPNGRREQARGRNRGHNPNTGNTNNADEELGILGTGAATAAHYGAAAITGESAPTAALWVTPPAISEYLIGSISDETLQACIEKIYDLAVILDREHTPAQLTKTSSLWERTKELFVARKYQHFIDPDDPTYEPITHVMSLIPSSEIKKATHKLLAQAYDQLMVTVLPGSFLPSISLNIEFISKLPTIQLIPVLLALTIPCSAFTFNLSRLNTKAKEAEVNDLQVVCLVGQAFVQEALRRLGENTPATVPLESKDSLLIRQSGIAANRTAEENLRGYRSTAVPGHALRALGFFGIANSGVNTWAQVFSSIATIGSDSLGAGYTALLKLAITGLLTGGWLKAQEALKQRWEKVLKDSKPGFFNLYKKMNNLIKHNGHISFSHTKPAAQSHDSPIESSHSNKRT